MKEKNPKWKETVTMGNVASFKATQYTDTQSQCTVHTHTGMGSLAYGQEVRKLCMNVYRRCPWIFGQGHWTFNVLGSIHNIQIFITFIVTCCIDKNVFIYLCCQSQSYTPMLPFQHFSPLYLFIHSLNLWTQILMLLL